MSEEAKQSDELPDAKETWIAALKQPEGLPRAIAMIQHVIGQCRIDGFSGLVRKSLQNALHQLCTAPERGLGDEAYLVWSNEHNAWWGPNHRGYYVLVENAGRYTKEEACKICHSANYGWDGDTTRPNELPISESAAKLIGLQKQYRNKCNGAEGEVAHV